jgi:restriction endonuclease Mrr
MVECKNWSTPVGAPEVESFIGKMRRRQCKNGIFVAACSVTGGFPGRGARGAARLIETALAQDGIRLIVFRMSDLEAIRSVDDLRTLLKRRVCLLYASKVF